MAIIKNIDIRIDSDKANLSEKLYFYKGDRNVIVSVIITNLSAKIVRMSRMNLDEVTSVNIAIVKPDGSVKYVKDLDVANGRFNWVVTEDLTEQIGEYKFQVNLIEEYSKLTIPNCTFEVLEPIAEVDSETTPSNAPICGEVVCGEAICGGTTKSAHEEDEIKIETSLSKDFLDRFSNK